MCPVLYFHNASKALVLNQTNWRTIAKAYGDNSEGWGDKVVELFKSETDYGGEMVPCVRVRIPQVDHQAPPPPPAPRSSFNDMNDDIPF